MGSGSRGKKRGRERRDSGPGRGRNASGCVGAWDIEVESGETWNWGLGRWPGHMDREIPGWGWAGVHGEAGRKLGA